MTDDYSMDLDRYTYRLLALAAVTLLAAGTVFFHIVEKLSWLNAYYFCVVTLSTVGYGDIVPKTPLGKFGVTIYIILGVGIIAAFLQATAKRQAVRRQERVEERQNRRSDSKAKG